MTSMLALISAFIICPHGSLGAHSEWVAIFDGKTLKGWHVSTQTGHGSGGLWVVEKGAIVGTQDKPRSGGIIITDAQYGNFEVELEMNNDYGPDSGLFLRSTEKGEAYQAMIDYHKDGNLMGVYGENIGGWISRNFVMLDSPDKIREEPNSSLKLPISPEKWGTFWKHGKWNKFKARIEGNPPKLTTWINGVKFMEHKDTEKRLPDKGGIALQVHGGQDYTGQFVRYRRIKVRELNK